MVWLIRTRRTRRRLAVLVGAACTSVLMGVIVFNRLLSQQQQQQKLLRPFTHLTKQCSSCSNTSSSSTSYAKLRKHEATRIFKDSVVKRVDVVFLGSNSPIEDRFVVGMSENLGAVFLSMIDGHKGYSCSHYLQQNMLRHISSHLHNLIERKDDLRSVLDMDAVERKFNALSSDQDSEVPMVRGGTGDGVGVAVEKIKQGLRSSLMSLDDEISKMALGEWKLVLSGHSMTDDMKARILTAVEGACALTAVVRKDDMIVANTGDCRVVLGQNQGVGNWKPLPLSVDQNAQNADEVRRVLSAHPGENQTAIFRERVLGSLMPFRTFGDVDFKWEKKYIERLPAAIPLAYYKTPPYITAEPVLSEHKFKEGDRFVILATDGLWERMSNEQAVNVVGSILSPPKRSLLEKLTKKASHACCEVNVATELLWHALGGTESEVSQLLHLDPQISRYHRDDITIMVVHL